MNKKNKTAPHSATDKIWLVESNYFESRDAIYGSAVLIRGHKENTQQQKTFHLLTCAHVVVNEKGQVANKIYAWQPGTKFAKPAHLYETEHLYKDAYEAEVCIVPNQPNTNHIQSHLENDWALLAFQSKQPTANSKYANNWATEIPVGDDYRFTILGYFNGLPGVRENGKVVIQPDKVMGNRIEESSDFTLAVKGGESTRGGTSGGGLFDNSANFYGIHLAASETQDKRFALNTIHLKQSLIDNAFCPETDSLDSQPHDHIGIRIPVQLPTGVLFSMAIFFSGLLLYLFESIQLGVFLVTSIVSGLIFALLCVVEWIVLVKPLSEGGRPFRQRVELLKRDIFNQHSYRYLLSLYSRSLTKLFENNTVDNSGNPQFNTNSSPFKRYFTPTSFDRVLLLAFTYPLISMMLTWCHFGDLRIGSLTALPSSDAESWNRYLMVGLLLISIFFLSLPTFLVSSNKFVRLVLPFMSGGVALLSVIYFYKLTINDEIGFDTNVPILVGSLFTITIIAGFSKLRIRESTAALVTAIYIGTLLLLITGYIRIEIDDSIIKAVFFDSIGEAIYIANANTLPWSTPPKVVFVIVLSTFAFSLYYSMYIVLSNIKRQQFSGFATTLVGLSLSIPCTLALNSTSFNAVHVSFALAGGLVICDIVLRTARIFVTRHPNTTYTLLYIFTLLSTIGLLICVGYYLPEIGYKNVNEDLQTLSVNYASVIFLYVMCLLPLLNAPLDWISLSTTRVLLEKIASKQHWWKNLIIALTDVLLACMYFLAVLGLLTIGFKAANKTVIFGTSLNTQFNQPFIDDMGSITPLLQENFSSANLWLWLLFATTLLPTTVHLLLTLLSFIGLLSTKDSKKIVETFREYLEIAKNRDAEGHDFRNHAPFIGRFQAIGYLVILPTITIISWLGISLICLTGMVYAANMLIGAL